MTHMRPMDESEGEFTNEFHSGFPCRQCGGGGVMCQTWESSDGAYEDYKYTCADCHAVWWVDGIDA